VQQIFGNVDETTNSWRDQWVDHGRTFGPPAYTAIIDVYTVAHEPELTETEGGSEAWW